MILEELFLEGFFSKMKEKKRLEKEKINQDKKDDKLKKEAEENYKLHFNEFKSWWNNPYTLNPSGSLCYEILIICKHIYNISEEDIFKHCIRYIKKFDNLDEEIEDHDNYEDICKKIIKKVNVKSIKDIYVFMYYVDDDFYIVFTKNTNGFIVIDDNKVSKISPYNEISNIEINKYLIEKIKNELSDSFVPRI